MPRIAKWLCAVVVGLAGSAASAEDFTFINRTNLQVDYQLAHANPERKVVGSVGAGQEQTHRDLTAWGDRAILVWNRQGKLLYAGKGGALQQGFNLTLTLMPDPKNPQEFRIVPALSR